MACSIITLTTDFGWRDVYGGSMKGAVLAVNPNANLVDVTHDVPPQDIAHAAFVIAGACPTFPPAATHVCVVDPGVGTERKAIVLDTPEGRFVAPDNGLLTLVMSAHCERNGTAPPFDSGAAEVMRPVTGGVPSGISAYAMDRPRYWRNPVSDTFHGRDVFAPAAAHLSLGVRPEEMGSPVEELVWLNFPRPTHHGSAIEGQVVYVDGFGNLVANVRASALPRGPVVVEVGEAQIDGLGHSYAAGRGLVAVAGSHGYLEIAEPNGNAAVKLGVEVGGRVRVSPAGT